MTVVHGGELRFIETPGGNFGSGVATPSRGAREVSVVRQRQQPGGANPEHIHDREEVVVVLAGSITVTAGEQSHLLGPGDAVIIPPRTSHRLENPGGEPAEWLLVAPAGVRFFHATGEEGTPPWAR